MSTERVILCYCSRCSAQVSPVRVCRCLERGAPQHDGKLPAGSNLSADGEVRWAGSFIQIECGRHAVMLNRKQGRLLLDWLHEKLAKEWAE